MVKMFKEITIEKMLPTKTITGRDLHHLTLKIVEDAKILAMRIINICIHTIDNPMLITNTKEGIQTQVENLVKTLIRASTCSKAKVMTGEEDIKMVAVKITSAILIRVGQDTEGISVTEETTEDTKTEGIVRGLFV
jgi:hypothetical protein